MPDGLINNMSTGGLFDNISTSALLASVLWGGIGGGFLVYGWKQKAMIPFIVGVALSCVSYFLLSSAPSLDVGGERGHPGRLHLA